MKMLLKILVMVVLIVSALPVAAQDPSAPCTISTARRNTARIRDTPSSRGARLGNLAQNTPFNVTGRWLDSKNALWYRVIKEEALPAATAPELWVAAAQVTPAGNCDAIPVLSPPPPPVLPQAGTWRVTYDNGMMYSCVGYETQTSTRDAVGLVMDPHNFRLVRVDNGFTLDGSLFALTGDGKFNGTLLQNELGNVILLITVESETRMTGAVIANLVINDIPCSLGINTLLERTGR